MPDYPSQFTRTEPDTQACTDDGHSLHSIAISLKRIADQLDGSAPGFNLMDLAHAVAERIR